MRLVFLHALPLDGTMWAEMDLGIESTIAPTLYRFGNSLADWAGGVLDLAGDGPLLLVGNSVGGSCALEIARLAPDRVAAMVLVGAKAGVRPEPGVRDEAVRLLHEGGMVAAWPKYWEPLFGVGAHPATVENARRIAFALDIDDVVGGVRAFHDRVDRTDVVRTWPKPLVVVSGDLDRTPPPTTAAALAAMAEKGTFRRVDDCGHYVTVEQPRRFEAILRQVMLELDAV